MAEKPGLKAVDLFRAIGEGRIKALWIIHTNPAVTLPEADAFVAREKQRWDQVITAGKISAN